MSFNGNRSFRSAQTILHLLWGEGLSTVVALEWLKSTPANQNKANQRYSRAAITLRFNVCWIWLSVAGRIS